MSASAMVPTVVTKNAPGERITRGVLDSYGED
ncbi:hypothetical protein V525_07225 [Gordonia alkanivorans CGMCC 6845]|uniref:Uncharacterized protein n=1 Tax=Gordonia alkanivorans CGMCC 6845 TaxID=1423140 RepID=W9DGG3_9ACTN|nr:hypothetical protein V525_07225 [Gordonia alkanivorans CGMCC 6845]